MTPAAIYSLTGYGFENRFPLFPIYQFILAWGHKQFTITKFFYCIFFTIFYNFYPTFRISQNIHFSSFIQCLVIIKDIVSPSPAKRNLTVNINYKIRLLMAMKVYTGSEGHTSKDVQSLNQPFRILFCVFRQSRSFLVHTYSLTYQAWAHVFVNYLGIGFSTLFNFYL